MPLHVAAPDDRGGNNDTHTLDAVAQRVKKRSSDVHVRLALPMAIVPFVAMTVVAMTLVAVADTERRTLVRLRVVVILVVAGAIAVAVTVGIGVAAAAMAVVTAAPAASAVAVTVVAVIIVRGVMVVTCTAVRVTVVAVVIVAAASTSSAVAVAVISVVIVTAMRVSVVVVIIVAPVATATPTRSVGVTVVSASEVAVAVVPSPRQHGGHHEVARKSAAADDTHHLRIDGLARSFRLVLRAADRGHNPPNRLDDDAADERPDGEDGAQCPQHLGPFPPIRVLGRRAPAAGVDGKQRQQQRADIREHVGRIGENSERMGNEADGAFGNHEAEAQSNSRAQRAARFRLLGRVGGCVGRHGDRVVEAKRGALAWAAGRCNGAPGTLRRLHGRRACRWCGRILAAPTVAAV